MNCNFLHNHLLCSTSFFSTTLLWRSQPARFSEKQNLSIVIFLYNILLILLVFLEFSGKMMLLFIVQIDFRAWWLPFLHAEFKVFSTSQCFYHWSETRRYCKQFALFFEIWIEFQMLHPIIRFSFVAQVWAFISKMLFRWTTSICGY